MRSTVLAPLLLIASFDVAFAQDWSWGENGPRFRSYYDDRYSRGPTWNDDRYARRDYDRVRPAPRYQPWLFPWDQPSERRRSNSWDEYTPGVMDGGGRPEIAAIQPDTVPFPSQYAVGSIIIDTRSRQLFLVKSEREAYRYPISVGRDGFTWNGTEKISRIADWPDWHPPQEMRERDPSLPEKMTGGLRNPLGAKALYLGNTLYRIHGTNDAKTIGQAASSGCFRMLNGHVIDLASRVNVGTPVTVVERLPPEVAKAVPPPARNLGQPSEQARARRW